VMARKEDEKKRETSKAAVIKVRNLKESLL
jgi:hypothetical protein